MSSPTAAATPRLPRWAEELGRAYTAGVASVFLIHGNIHDLVPVHEGSTGSPPREFVSLERFLAERLFGRRDIVIQFDRGAGLGFPGDRDRAQRMRQDFRRTLEAMDTVLGTDWARSGLKDPKVVFEVLDRFILAKTAARAAAEAGEASAGRSLAVLIRYAETIAPAVDVGWLAGEVGAHLLKLLNWANDPAIRNADATICLLVENLAELNRRVVENPFIAKVEIPLPGDDERQEYVAHLLSKDSRLAAVSGLDARAAAREANGLTLVGVAQALGQVGASGRADLAALRESKKELIEKQCFGLVDFVEPRYDLDMVVAQPAVLERLRQDARLIREARHEALPMGYLICGVLGTGKTFTATCFAGTIGIPALVFRNLREKWVGSSEGNMQKVLAVVRALGPVVVIVDEADAALGNRGQEGDSGTSGRMFAMISSQMSDTAYRGKVIWMLLTCRPDLLPVDLKRQGRCELHIPLFVPQTDDERRAMFLAMTRKNKIQVDPADVPPLAAGLSGADIESIVVQSLREALLAGVPTPTPQMLKDTAARFVSPDYSLQKELQELVAVREATDLRFLPAAHQELRRDPVKAAAMERRIQELTRLVE